MMQKVYFDYNIVEGYDWTKAEDMQVIKDKNLFRTFCPEMVRSAVEILDEMINKDGDKYVVSFDENGYIRTIQNEDGDYILASID